MHLEIGIEGAFDSTLILRPGGRFFGAGLGCLLLLVTGCDSAQESPSRLLPVEHVAFSSDGKWLAAAGGILKGADGRSKSGKGFVKIWQSANWAPHAYWDDAFADLVWWIDFTSSNALTIATHRDVNRPIGDCTLRSWDIALKKELPPVDLDKSRHGAGMVAYFAAGKLVAYNHLDLGIDLDGNTTSIFSLPKLDRAATLKEHPSGAFLRFSPDGKRILSYVQSKDFRKKRKWPPLLRVYDVATGDLVAHHDLDSVEPAPSLPYARFSPDGKMIGATTKSEKVWVLKSDLSQVLLKVDGGSARLVEFTPDNALIATQKGRNSIQLTSTSSGKVESTFTHNPEGVNCCAFSPDGTWIAIGGGNHLDEKGTQSPGKVRLFEVKTGKLLAELE